jgi:hypothetical protein
MQRNSKFEGSDIHNGKQENIHMHVNKVSILCNIYYSILYPTEIKVSFLTQFCENTNNYYGQNTIKFHYPFEARISHSRSVKQLVCRHKVSGVPQFFIRNCIFAHYS